MLFRSGGEPTLNPELVDLLKYIKKAGGKIELMSNGSADLKWWAKLAVERLIDNLALGVHVEQGINLDQIYEGAKSYDMNGNGNRENSILAKLIGYT